MALLLVRHGESEGNAGGIIQGQLDMGLTPLGRQQARWTGEALSGQPVQQIVSSPLERARLTAEMIGAALNLTVRLDDRLMEYGFGELSGLDRAEIAVRFPQVALGGFAGSTTGMWTPIPGEEGRTEFFGRVRESINELANEAGDGLTVVVTHGGFLNAACHHVAGIDYETKPARFHFANCSFTEFVRERTGRLVLKRHNDTCHLDRATDADYG